MKDSYRISKILQKLTGFKFLSQKHQPDLSQKGQERAADYYSDKRMVKNIKKIDELSSKNAGKYIQFQKETEAGRLLKSDYKPKNPGKILKLPTNRSEIKLKE